MDLTILFRKEAFNFDILELRENQRLPLWFVSPIDQTSSATLAKSERAQKFIAQIPFAQKYFFEPERFPSRI
jgi:hypothetical protein